ncbi:MAG: L,D-transpeptidase family protein [Akkermansiaceae bacterium]|nr:L,D-transpeptidase family protein [Akkermansiaceae bacterium]
MISIFPAIAFELPANSTQCIVGIADDWNSSKVSLTLFEKTKSGWKPVSPAWPGRLGKNGLIWGKGINPNPPGARTKQEGDNRSPAGVFDIGGVWGYEKSIRKHPALAYRQVTSRDLWVEDPASPKYNHNVILDREPETEWEKKQQMKQTDPVHSLKLFIAHNAPPKVTPNAGSSIFFHIWRADGARATAGCTTMEEGKLQWMISKIDPTRRPLYVLLTKADYEKLRDDWKLP